ncbi:MAG: PfkB family carbohydrate kinase [Gammaproteobacteria bacterium]|nr:PfkB family carbohydrate kinase [Gammaproteobacteria bacterium]MCF6362400.1 PfkB family carbohydrate kinase [Gammaproteobacteria bacterium]
MANILGIGIATLDIVNHVAAWPAEDEEVRALAQDVRRGGNVTNTLVVLSQLGHRCRWAGTLADDSGSAAIRNDLMQYDIDTAHVQQIPGAHAPTSYIALNVHNGSRTIIHYRDLPEYGLDAFHRIDLQALDWLHAEGRNVVAVAEMLKDARRQYPQLPLSVEIEKPREHIEQLCGLADLLIYSRHYALHQLGAEAPITPEAIANTFLRRQQQRAPQAIHVCSWGEHGAYGLAPDSELFHSPAFTPPKVIDTLGAGDTFNAGLIHARLAGQGLTDSLRSACRLAGDKVGRHGFHGLTTQSLQE